MENHNKTIKFLESSFNDIVNTIGFNKAETGGLLFGNEEDYIVRKIVFDKNAKTTSASYTFNTEFLNPEIKRLWNEERLSCIGFIHSHPIGYAKPSPPDISYFTSMFQYMPRKQYIIPIVFTVPDGGFKLNGFILPNGTDVPVKANIELLPDNFTKEPDNFTPVVKDNTITEERKKLTFEEIFFKTDEVLFKLAKIIFVYGSIWFLFKTLNIITNNLLQ